eukprot:m.149442 g.149442  ORF g.149442 m.149442 type:complete len:143 (+) comp23249_c0_seq1:876-1304(+)
MQWFGREDERDWLKASWAEVSASSQRNHTIALQTLMAEVPGVQLWAMHTAVSTNTVGKVRIQPNKVDHMNAVIRSVAETTGVALMDWDLMGHRGWSRPNFLMDDMHGGVVFNHAVGNVLLNAVAALPRKGNPARDPAPATRV